MTLAYALQHAAKKKRGDRVCDGTPETGNGEESDAEQQNRLASALIGKRIE